MYYNSYGYSGVLPNMPGGFMNQVPGTMIPQNNNNYSINQWNDINERISRLERQVKRLDQRLTRIETPYANQNYNNEPDNNMYMM